MNSAEILKRAKEVVQIARVPAEEVPPVKNFLDYGALVVHAAKSLSARDRQAMPWIMDWATGFRRLYDNFAAEVEADPMLLYEPANPVALAFHKSPKYVRYFMAGNRSSKTQSGFAEDYWVLTGQHPYWDLGTGRTAVALVPGMTFTQYDETVLGPKWFSHEPGNPLSPIFPENGKWFYHLDERKHTLLVACPECAAAKKAQSCKHPKSRFTWFSEELGFEALQGAVYNLVHFDEDLADQKFFAEAKTRTLSCQGRIVLTGTPLHGDQAWEQKEVYFPWLSANRNHEVIEVFTVSMYEGGIISKEAVDQYKASLEDEFEIRARIYGEPLPISNSPVFDRTALREMRAAHAKPPERGWLRFKEATIRPEMVQPDSAIEFAADASAPYRIWEKPVPGAVYVVGVDVASGMYTSAKGGEGDASCASVLRVTPHGHGLALELVAQFHGWANPSDYADYLMPLLVYYNSALCIVEVTGIGLGTAIRIKNEYYYWNLYREPTSFAAVSPTLDPQIGVSTNAASKPFMVAALQFFVKERRLKIYDEATYQELSAYEEVKKSKSGLALAQAKYQGAGGSRDDRVMSLALAAGVIYARPDIGHLATYSDLRPTETSKASPEMIQLYKELAAEQGTESQL